MTNPAKAPPADGLALRLYEQWQSGEEPDARQLLFRAGPLTAAQVVAVLRVDQRERWHRGKALPAETYLQWCPKLADDPEAALELVYAEYVLREELGEVPATAEYLARFPQYAARLRQQIELHQALADFDGTAPLVAEGAAVSQTDDTMPFRSRPEPPPQPPALPRVAGYEILSELGRGGMGVVYQARHLKLKRLVALKMILAGEHAGAQQRARFRREAEAVARLQHPNIVQIHEVGEQDGRPYCALELLEGGSLAKRLRGAPQPPRDAARLIETLARAVHTAHQHSILHRDLKPANVLLAEDGTPKVADFGLARQLDADRQTETGDIVGTPSYMAPEQAAAGREVGPPADVYALGALLYECLTGRPPFRAATPLDTVLQVLNDEPVPVRRLQPRTPADLETVCLKCLQKDPRKRYASALDLADDLARFLRDEPIRARPVGRVERGWRWCRRNPVLATMTAAVAALLVVIAAGASLLSLRLAAALDESEQGRAEVKRAEREGRHKLLAAHVNEARALRFSRQIGQRFGTLQALEKAVALACELDEPPATFAELRNLALAALALPDLKPAAEWIGDPREAGWNTSGRVVDPLLRFQAVCEPQGTVSIRKVGVRAEDTGEIARLSGGKGPVRLMVAPQGRALAVWHRDMGPRLQVWRIGDGKPSLALEETGYRGFCFTPDGRGLVVTRGGTLHVYDLERRTSAAVPGERLAPQYNAGPAHHPHLPQVALATADELVVLDLRTGQPVRRRRTASPAGQLVWHPDGERLAFTLGHSIHLWDVKRDALSAGLEHRGGGVGLGFNAAGDLLASHGWDGRLNLWGPNTGREVFRAQQVPGDASFGPDDRLLQPFSDLWKKRAGPLVQVEAAREYRTLVAGTTEAVPVRDYGDCAVHPDGRLLAVSTWQGVSLVDLATGTERAFIPGVSPHVLFEPSGALLTRFALRLQRWPVRADAKDPLRLRVGPPEQIPLPGRVHSMARSADGTVLAVAAGDGARVWRRGRPAEALHLRPHTDCRYVAVSPDGKRVATGTHNGFGVKVWDAATGKLLRELRGGTQWTRPTFSPDGSWLFDRHGRSWRTVDWSEGPRHPGATVAVAPDTALMACDEHKGFIPLLDPATGRELARLEDPHQDALQGLTFSPDGALLLGVTNDSSCVRVWDLRKLREGLARLGLDWEAPAYRPAPRVAAGPLQVEIDRGKAE